MSPKNLKNHPARSMNKIGHFGRQISQIWNLQSAFRWKIFQIWTKQLLMFSLVQKCLAISLGFMLAVTWNSRPLKFLQMLFLGWFLAFLDIHHWVEQWALVGRATPRLFGPCETTDRHLYWRLDGRPPPINRNQLTLDKSRMAAEKVISQHKGSAIQFWPTKVGGTGR